MPTVEQIPEKIKSGEVPTNPEINEKIIEDSFNRNVALIGSELHDEWRATRLKEDGSYEPRIKKTTDTVWIKAHGGETQVDIANTPYPELPADWQAENKKAAEAALENIYDIWFYREGKYLPDKDFLNFKANIDWESSEVHEDWLSRNKEWAPPEQKVPYEELPEGEQRKDREIAVSAKELIEKELAQNKLRVPEKLILKWLSRDITYLLELTDKEAFERKKREGKTYVDKEANAENDRSTTFESIQNQLGNWKVETLDFEPLGDRKIKLHVEIPQDRISINGIFPIEAVAQFVNLIRNKTPDLPDPRSETYEKQRKESVQELLENQVG